MDRTIGIAGYNFPEEQTLIFRGRKRQKQSFVGGVEDLPVLFYTMSPINNGRGEGAK